MAALQVITPAELGAQLSLRVPDGAVGAPVAGLLRGGR